jgi:hypothetical protein
MLEAFLTVMAKLCALGTSTVTVAEMGVSGEPGVSTWNTTARISPPFSLVFIASVSWSVRW